MNISLINPYYLKVKVLVNQLCLTLWDHMGCTAPGSSMPGILKARILEWVAISFSRGSSQPGDQTWVSCTAGRFFTAWASREVLRLLPFSSGSVAQSCPTLWDPMNRSTPGLPVHHQTLEFTQTHARRVGDAIQPSHPLSSPSPPALNLSQHQGIFQGVSSSHQVAKVLEFILLSWYLFQAFYHILIDIECAFLLIYFYLVRLNIF